MSELKPCPFCGGKARIYMNDSDLDNIMWYCMCTNDRGCNVMPITLDQYSEEEAAAAWNTRHLETCHNASYRLDESRFHCSECGFGCWVKDVADGRDKLPKHCPNCGRKVMDQ